MRADRAATPVAPEMPETPEVPVVPAESTIRSQITVMSIPADHVYPAAVRPEGVDYLPDPDIDGNWWPHPALDATWWDDPANGRDVDVVHLHFGFDHLSADETAAFTRALRRRGIPLVVTAHDLDNPHLEDQSEHHEKVRILVAAADRVITLTDAARRQLAAATAADGAVVIPHPRVVETRHSDRPDAGIVGVFLKSLRGNVITDAAFYRTLADTLADSLSDTLADATLRVHIHDVEQTRPLIAELEHSSVDLRVHDALPDDELHAAVAECTTVVLPYIRGTHSGWLEMCRDLGVTVAAPDCGCYLSQADDPSAVADYRTGDPLDAAATVTRLLGRGRLPYRGDRSAQLAQIRAAHAAVYREVTGS